MLGKVVKWGRLAKGQFFIIRLGWVSSADVDCGLVEFG